MARSALLENGPAASAIKRKMASACCRKRRSKVRASDCLQHASHRRISSKGLVKMHRHANASTRNTCSTMVSWSRFECLSYQISSAAVATCVQCSLASAGKSHLSVPHRPRTVQLSRYQVGSVLCSATHGSPTQVSSDAGDTDMPVISTINLATRHMATSRPKSNAQPLRVRSDRIYQGRCPPLAGQNPHLLTV